MKTKLLLGMLMAGILTLGSGCALLVVGAAAGAGAGTYAYVDGELKDTESVPYDTACAATISAMKDLGYAVVGDQRDAITAKITARTTGDKKVQITLTKQAAKVTEIRIRVGVFGEEELSRQILAQIKSHF